MNIEAIAGRINISILAVVICWFVTAITVGLYTRDVRGYAVSLVWSLPQFIAGWVLIALPVVALGDKILRIPAVVWMVIGAISGFLIMLLPFFIELVFSSGTSHYKFEIRWAWFRGWPSFGAAIGACGMTLYRWLLSKSISRQKTT